MDPTDQKVCQLLALQPGDFDQPLYLTHTNLSNQEDSEILGRAQFKLVKRDKGTSSIIAITEADSTLGDTNEPTLQEAPGIEVPECCEAYTFTKGDCCWASVPDHLSD